MAPSELSVPCLPPQYIGPRANQPANYLGLCVSPLCSLCGLTRYAERPLASRPVQPLDPNSRGGGGALWQDGGPGCSQAAPSSLGDLAGKTCSATAGASSATALFLAFWSVCAWLVFVRTVFSLVCVATACLVAFLAASFSATLIAHCSASSLKLRKVFGTWKVPNLLCRAKTPWSCARGQKGWGGESAGVTR